MASKANACKESKKVAKEEKAQACDEVSVAQDAKVEAPKEETAKAVAPKTTEVERKAPSKATAKAPTKETSAPKATATRKSVSAQAVTRDDDVPEANLSSNLKSATSRENHP